MSRLHRAVEKAEREGLLEWTQPLDQRTRRGADDERRAAAAAVRETGPEVAADVPAPSTPPEPPREPFLRAAADRWPAHDWDAEAGPDPAPAPAAPWLDGIEVDALAGIGLNPIFVAATEPGSPAAEQYRLLQTRLEARDGARRTQVLLVTSPSLGDGKTTTSANLALTMAREFQQRVVLVEADLRRPSLAAQFGLQVEGGLVDVLLGGLSLDDALVQIPGHQLTLLPAGAEAARSTELVASSMMPRVLDLLRARFDRIVIDTTPVALADTHVLARLADGVLVVVRSGITPRPALERALASIDRERLLGIVLNEVDDAPGAYSYPGLEYSGRKE